VYDVSSAGGTIEGGEAALDARFRVFRTTAGGMVSAVYRPPAVEGGKAVIQVVSVDGEGQVSGLLGKAVIRLSTTNGYPEPQSPQPVLQSISPAKGSSGVPRNAVITARFSQPIDPVTLHSANFNLKRGGYGISGTLTLSEDGRVVTFTPAILLSPNSVFRVYISSNIRSTEGKNLLNYVYSTFSTGVTEDSAAPSVTGVNPSDGMAGIGINAAVTVEFSEQMDASSINEGSFTVSRDGANVPGRIEVTRGNRTATFRPEQQLEPDTEYTVEVSSAVRDVAGNEMGTGFSSSFVTATGKDVTRPSVTGVTPGSGAVDVPEDMTVTVTFSEPVNPLSIGPGTLYLLGPGGAVPGVFTLGSGNTTVGFTPLYPLFAGAVYSLNVTKGVTDTAGNPLLSPFASGFTVAESPNTDIQPTRATITVNPKSMFADGKTPTTVIISDINNNGTPVPNGTVVAVTVDPAFVRGSVGGVVSGASTGVSPDTRFTLFETYGAKVEFSYTPPDMTWMPPGSLAYGVIQLASVDAEGRPVRLVASGDATLYGIDDAKVQTQGVYVIGTIITYPTGSTVLAPGEGLLEVNDPYKYLEDIDYVVVGTEWHDLEPSTVTVTVKDREGNLVPDGTRVGLTAAPVYTFNTVGGRIEGGTPSRVNADVQIFTTRDGQFTATYVPPVQVYNADEEILQVLTVDSDDNVTGLVSTGILYFRFGYRVIQ